jgi:hypothetical protein
LCEAKAYIKNTDVRGKEERGAAMDPIYVVLLFAVLVTVFAIAA